MLKKIITYIKDNEFRVNIYKNKINVVNYDEILIMEPTRVTLKHQEGLLVIRGDNLIINKLLEQELLITGSIKTIELGD